MISLDNAYLEDDTKVSSFCFRGSLSNSVGGE